jgi:hypothetical protein
VHNHGLTWIKGVLRFRKSMNEEIENVVEKYLTPNQIVLNINKHVRKNDNTFVDFNILNLQPNLQKYCYFK